MEGHSPASFERTDTAHFKKRKPKEGRDRRGATGGNNKKGEHGKRDKKPEGRQWEERHTPPFTSPFDQVREGDLYAAHRRAHHILHTYRPELPPAKGEWDRQMYLHTENERLTAVFEHNESKKTREEQQKSRRDKAISEIFEAMLFTGARQMWGGEAALLPSEFDDRKNATDLVVRFKDGDTTVALALDAANEQDVAGYSQPDGTVQKGVEHKMMRSYRQVASDFRNLTRVQYASDGKETVSLEHMPRVVVGASQEAIMAAAGAWAKGGEGAFEHAPLFQEIRRSVEQQLISQLVMAREEGKRKTAQGKDEIQGVVRANQEAVEYEKVLRVLGRRIGHTPPLPPTAKKDSVIAAIDATTRNRNVRERLMAEARRVQGEFHTQQGFLKDERGGKAQWDMPLTAPLLPSEEKHLADFFAREKTPEATQTALRAFLAGTRPDFPPEVLTAVAGGVPARVYKRLKDARSTAPSPTHVPTEAHVDTSSHHITAPAAPHVEASSGVHTEHAHIHETHASIEGAPLSAHLAALVAQKGKFETRGSRWASRFKNGLFNGLSSLAGFVGAKSVGWLLCGLGAGVPAVLAGSIAAALAASVGSHLWFKKKKWMDDPYARERASAIASIERMKVTHPYIYASLVGNKDRLEKEVEKRTRRRIWGGRAALIAANSAFSLGVVEHRTGGRFLDTVFSHHATWGEKVQKTLALFACANAPVPTGGGGGTAATGVVPGSGKGGAVAMPPNTSGRGFHGVTDLGGGKSHGVPPPHPADLTRRGVHNPWESWYGRKAPRAPFGCHMNVCNETLLGIQSQPRGNTSWVFMNGNPRSAWNPQSGWGWGRRVPGY